MTKPRTIKNVSFADSDYEQGLLEFATKPEHGPFSVYVKRLIERDRAGIVAVTPVQVTQPAPVQKPPTSEKDREEAMRLLF